MKKNIFLFVIIGIVAVVFFVYILTSGFFGVINRSNQTTGEVLPVNAENPMQKAASKNDNIPGASFGPMGNGSENEADHGYVNPASNPVSHTPLQTVSESVDTDSEFSESGSGNAPDLFETGSDQRAHGSWTG